MNFGHAIEDIEIVTEQLSMTIEELYDLFENCHQQFVTPNGTEVLETNGLEVLTIGKDNLQIFGKVSALTRHFVEKDIWKISTNNDKHIECTADHTCMKYDIESELIQCTPSDGSLNIGDSFLTDEGISQIKSMDNLGKTKDYVYDICMESTNHVFFGNGILVHNSVYVNGEVPFRDALDGRIPDFKNKEDLEKISKHIESMASVVNDYLGEEIQKKFCHSPLKRLNFKVEAIADRAIWLAAKNYVVHVLIKEGVDQIAKDGSFGKFKYVGVAIQKNELPDSVKNVLKDIVENGLLEGWDSKKYNDRLMHYWKIYSKMDWNELSFINTYGSHKEPEGFLEFSKGTHYVIKAVVTFNQLLKKMGLSRKYMEAVLGDKVRLCYINEDNQYYAKTIAWPNELPKEMKNVFSIDYETMFEKTILSKLKKFEVAFKWRRSSVLNEYEISIDDL